MCVSIQNLEERSRVIKRMNNFVCSCNYCSDDRQNRRCYRCGQTPNDILKYNQCKNAYYCNADCQKSHWLLLHKYVCNK